MNKTYYVYILASKKGGVLYIGVTNNIIRRIYEHKSGLVEGFTKKYFIKSLMYYETYENVNDAINREKQLKAGSRKKKIELIEQENKDWKDLYQSLT